MRFNFVDKSQLWSGIAILMFGSGVLAGLAGMVTAERIGETVIIEKRFEPELLGSDCTVGSTFYAGAAFGWAKEYSVDGFLSEGLKISNLDHCKDLLRRFPENLDSGGTDLKPSANGSIVSTSTSFDREWSKDLGRRLLLLIGGILIGFVAALPWIAVYQVTRRLEEIRDRSK